MLEVNLPYPNEDWEEHSHGAVFADPSAGGLKPGGCRPDPFWALMVLESELEPRPPRPINP
jgi:hypothetical protein